jgi:teichuronic acid biosynthesis glycosyltransferase TuaG
MPHVSIIMPAYNAEATLEETLASLYAQTFPDWELCIVDDASKDNTAAIIKRHAANDSRIKPIFLAKNGGAANAQETSLQAGTGRYAAFLDADDCWLPQKLEKHLAFMTAKKAPMSYTAYRRVNEDGSEVSAIIHPPAFMNYEKLLKNTAMASSSMIIDRDITGPFHIKQEGFYDLASWLSLFKQGHVAYGLDEDLMRYRVRFGSDSGNKFAAMKRVWHIYRNVEHLSLPYSVYCFAHYGFNAVFKRAKAWVMR